MSGEDSYLSGQPNVSEGWNIRQRSDHIPVPHTERVFPLQKKSKFLGITAWSDCPSPSEDLYPILPFGLTCNKVQWKLHICFLRLLKHSLHQLSRGNTAILSEIFLDHHSLKAKQGSTVSKYIFQVYKYQESNTEVPGLWYIFYMQFLTTSSLLHTLPGSCSLSASQWEKSH